MKKLLFVFMLAICSPVQASDFFSVVAADTTAAAPPAGDITFRSFTVANGLGEEFSPTIRTINAPAGLTQGDTLILVVRQDIAGTLTWPSGFTLIASVSLSNPSTEIVSIAQKVAGASEPATYDITIATGGYPYIRTAMFAWSGAAATTPIEDYTATAYDTSDGYQLTHTAVAVGVATGTAGRKLIQISGTKPGSSQTVTHTPPSGFTELFDQDEMGVSDYADSAGTDTGDKTSTFVFNGANDATRWAFLLALTPL